MRRLLDTISRRMDSEIGVVRKDHGGRVSVCLVYPNTYRVGMSSLGFQTIYHLFNSQPGVVCERAFVPDEEDLADLERTGAGLVSYESETPLGQFDAIAFSVSYELDYVGVARVLRLAKVPAMAAERGEEHPIVMAGGAAVTINPEPLGDLMDMVVLGEGEEVVGELVGRWQEEGRAGRQRPAGIGVPALQDGDGTAGIGMPALQDGDGWAHSCAPLRMGTAGGDRCPRPTERPTACDSRGAFGGGDDRPGVCPIRQGRPAGRHGVPSAKRQRPADRPGVCPTKNGRLTGRVRGGGCAAYAGYKPALPRTRNGRRAWECPPDRTATAGRTAVRPYGWERPAGGEHGWGNCGQEGSLSSTNRMGVGFG